MYTAFANVKVTPAYWEALMQNLDSDRAAAIAQAMASVGGKLHFFAFAHGRWGSHCSERSPNGGCIYVSHCQSLDGRYLQDVETIPCIAQKTVTEVMSSAGNTDYKAPGQ